jgi:hypothetical protein
MTPLQNGEHLDLAFDDTSPLDMTSAFDESGPFNHAAEFSSFDFR